jgi:hypothetical protein
MRIIYNRTAGILSQMARSRLRRISLHDAATTEKTLNELFPHQHVSVKHGRFQVTRKDGSVIVDIFQDGSSDAHWVESVVNLRMTT